MSDWMTVYFLDVPPSPIEVQGALADLGIPLLVVGGRENWEDASGFWPMVLDLKGTRIDLGVEIYPEATATFLSQRGFRDEPRFRHGLWFRWGASEASLFCAHALCAAFARVSECAIYDNYHPARLSVDDMKLVIDSVSASLPRLEEFYVAERDAWIAQFLEILRQRNAEFALNERVTWPNTEAYLTAESIFHQHSTTTFMSSLGAPRFVHSFAVSVHLSDIDGIGGLFGVGGRCDAGYSIRDAFERDLRPTRRGPQSEHARRKGFEDIVIACTTGAEDHLAPVYRAWLRTAAPTLLKCIEIVQTNPALLQDEVRRKHYEKRLNGRSLSATTIAAPGNLAGHLGSSLPEAVVCSNQAYLSKYTADLVGVAERLEWLLAS